MEIKKANLKFKHKLTPRKKTEEVVLHCSATKEGMNYSPADIHRWHLERGWAGAGYHFLITRDGTVWECRPEGMIGSHCLNHNTKSVSVCYIGGMDENNKYPRDTRTVEQKESMYRLVKELMEKYNLTLMDIHCHNEYANKACPCFKINDFRDEYLKWIE